LNTFKFCCFCYCSFDTSFLIFFIAVGTAAPVVITPASAIGKWESPAGADAMATVSIVISSTISSVCETQSAKNVDTTVPVSRKNIHSPLMGTQDAMMSINSPSKVPPGNLIHTLAEVDSKLCRPSLAEFDASKVVDVAGSQMVSACWL
jgi:hypothetical protein